MSDELPEANVHLLLERIKTLEQEMKNIEENIVPRVWNAEQLALIARSDKQYYDNHEYVKTIERQIDELKDKIKQLENCWHYGNPEKESKPYKCPICLGKGFIDFQQNPYLPLNSGERKCKPCDSKGILWS